MQQRWCYFIQLGSNMWRDKWSKPDFRGPVQTQVTGQYFDTMQTDRAVWRRVIDFLPSCGINTVVIDIGEGMQYETHPELSVPGAWSHEELRAELARMRKMGLEPIPKLNFSACHDTWLREYAWMKGTSTYYTVVQDLIDEVCRVFDCPSLFHIGMDEEDIPNHRKGMTIIRCNDLWCHDLYYYMDCVEKNGARPWIWGDFYWAHEDVFVQKIPKECLISNWWYERLIVNEDGTFTSKREMDTYAALADCGYDQIPTASTWACHQNIAQTVLFFHEKGIVNERLKGFMVAPWAKTISLNLYTLLNDAHRLKYAKDLFERLESEHVRQDENTERVGNK